MSSEELVKELVYKFNNDRLNRGRTFYLTFVQKERYMLIEFGVSKEVCFIFKEYLKPNTDLDMIKERLFQKVLIDVFERVHSLITRNKFLN